MWLRQRGCHLRVGSWRGEPLGCVGEDVRVIPARIQLLLIPVLIQQHPEPSRDTGHPWVRVARPRPCPAGFCGIIPASPGQAFLQRATRWKHFPKTAAISAGPRTRSRGQGGQGAEEKRAGEGSRRDKREKLLLQGLFPGLLPGCASSHPQEFPCPSPLCLLAGKRGARSLSALPAPAGFCLCGFFFFGG